MKSALFLTLTSFDSLLACPMIGWLKRSHCYSAPPVMCWLDSVQLQIKFLFTVFSEQQLIEGHFICLKNKTFEPVLVSTLFFHFSLFCCVHCIKHFKCHIVLVSAWNIFKIILCSRFLLRLHKHNSVSLWIWYLLYVFLFKFVVPSLCSLCQVLGHMLPWRKAMI